MAEPLTVDGRIPALHKMTPRAQGIALAYFEAGRVEGIAQGRAQAHAETWGAPPDDATAGRDLKRLTLLPPFADVLDRRGQHDHADRYRAMLKDRGLTS